MKEPTPYLKSKQVLHLKRVFVYRNKKKIKKDREEKKKKIEYWVICFTLVLVTTIIELSSYNDIKQALIN